MVARLVRRPGFGDLLEASRRTATEVGAVEDIEKHDRDGDNRQAPTE